MNLCIKSTLASASLILMGATCVIQHDTSALSAIEANDETVIFAGCGKIASDGLLHCRVSEGSDLSNVVTLKIPPLNCKRDSCAEVAIVRLDGTLVSLGGIKKGETSFDFNLLQLTGADGPAELGNGGPYRVLLDAYYEKNNEEFRVMSRGIIYLSVLKAGYLTLGCNSPDVAWALPVSEKCEAQFTTKFRTALCGGGCT